jgi:hypothetical protein
MRGVESRAVQSQFKDKGTASEAGVEGMKTVRSKQLGWTP